MWSQHKMHCPSHSSIVVLIIIIPLLLLISVIVLALFNPQNYYSFTWTHDDHQDSEAHFHHDSSYKKLEEDRLKKAEAVLAKARFSIREVAQNKLINSTSDQEHDDDDDDDDDYIPQGPVYRNPTAFLRSYQEMERVFKIYVYKEGERPIFHHGPCRSIYSTEGNFIYELERGSFYRTNDPREAHVFFLPFSVVGLVQYLYEPGSRDRKAIAAVVADYVQTISFRHPFWNSSLGADHFMLSCHDWGLCNANTSEGFNPLKDVPLPEINLNTGDMSGLLGGSPPSQRPILAFFAGRLHGRIRRILLKQWKGKDHDVQVYDELPRNISYESMLRTSKFCLCPSGYEVASPRVVEAIYAECVPVLISKGYVPPLSDVLEWEEFSIAVAEEDIPNVKKILMGIPKEKYLRMHERLREVQRHFVMNGPPKRFDLFHMIVHSIWLRRLNVRILRD
ncbi:UNVERIFIED_CONTAM: putative glycosyltransferase [Sesamum angustifolium]|uniref:Glycosyltransferase n=1 Tax=Sesamum angustifolium TaxID=2727405 RepID=A0AAW2KYY1_9LAMI